MTGIIRNPIGQLVVLAIALLWTAQLPAADLAAQSSREGGVVVTVKPLSLGAETWVFEIAFNTHSVDLGGNPATDSRLIDDNGEEHAPLAWEGDPAGGHHRKGVLRFAPLPEAKRVELRISGIGGISPRVFGWDL